MKNVLLILSFLISFVSISQKNGSIDSTVTALAVDINNVSFEIESTNLILTAHKNGDYYRSILTDIDSLVRKNGKKLHADYARFEAQEIRGLSKSSLDALISSWNMNKAEVASNTKKVRELFEKTTNSLAVLDSEKEKWSATLKVFEGTESAKELVVKITELIKEIGNVESELNENLSRLIRFETEIVEVSGLITLVEDQLVVANEERSKDVFVQNKPAIWNVIFTPKDSNSVVSDSIDSQSDTSQVASYSFDHINNEKLAVSLDFLTSHQETIFFFFILWFMTVGISLKYGRDAVVNGSMESTIFAKKAMMYVHKSLIASASYLSILYVVFLFDYIPLLITEILVILLIILNVIILYEVRGGRILKIAILLGITYIIGQTNAVSILGDVKFRFYLFAKIGITYWVLKLFIDYLRTYKDSGNLRVLSKLDNVMSLNKVLIVVSLLANILGFVKLSDLSSLLVIQVIVVSFIFYGILLTSNGLISIVFLTVWVPKNKSSLEFRESVEKRVIDVMNFFAIWFWVMAILQTVGIYDSIKSYIVGVISANIEIGSISISLQEVFAAVVVIILTFVLTRFIGIIISEGGLDSFKLKRGVPNAISLVVRYTLIAFGLMLAMSVAGIDLSSFSLMAGALGIGIGFGLQNIISNFVSGLILVFERPLQEGDVVEVNNLLGIVKNIGVRSSNIRTYTGSEVVVPNEALISKELINWTLSDPNKRIEVSVGVDYGTDPRLVIELLKTAAMANIDVQKDPAPSVFFENFGDSSLDFRLLFWVHHSIALSVRSDVMLRVSDILAENNINIPFPIRTLKMEKNVSSDLKIDPRKNENVDAGV